MSKDIKEQLLITKFEYRPSPRILIIDYYVTAGMKDVLYELIAATLSTSFDSNFEWVVLNKSVRVRITNTDDTDAGLRFEVFEPIKLESSDSES